ncbi:hypothetical protein [Biformimicrobium ophioploci]|uniref:Uncharacterized protein n=1 Tax=Biformimicrobium ophioploci TaxID=3036711 RepID=A0ABQ6M0N9_9GAMM|nr:hypothetical protein [Microbulbifer sp. NKW57]GMG87911.1 hypothetical protein MNKW57_22320 [Microbulbifer sp. NKW57]
MKIMNHLRFLSSALLLVGAAAQAAPWDTPDYYLCGNPVEGEWNYGRVPKGCDIDPWGDPQFAYENFGPLVFNDSLDRISERARYIDEMHSVIRESALYYLSQRKTPAEGEAEAWVHAMLAVAQQETFWSHYREAAEDARLKMIRGDSGHGHGMMQVDDRWHFDALENGAGWQIFANLSYAMDIYFTAWEDAASETCVNDGNWRERARSAYSMYNGGPSKGCRWTDPSDTWYRNDEAYIEKYDNQSWLDLMSNPDHVTALDIVCFVEASEGCSGVQAIDPDDLANWNGRVVRLESGESCIYDGSALDCVEKMEDFICLSLQHDVVAISTVYPSASVSDAISRSVQDRHQCWNAALDGLQQVGQSIRSVQGINLRETPGGTDTNVDTTVDGVYQVLDMVVRDQAELYRYYRVRVGDVEGYIYGGTAASAGEWAIAADHASLETVIVPQVGDTLTVLRADGIKIEDMPGGNEIGQVDAASEHLVDEVLVQGVDNHVYYKISAAGIIGYIYGGQLLGENTQAAWAEYKPKASSTGGSGSSGSGNSGSGSGSSTTEQPKKSGGGGGTIAWLLLMLAAASARRLQVLRSGEK